MSKTTIIIVLLQYLLLLGSGDIVVNLSDVWDEKANHVMIIDTYNPLTSESGDEFIRFEVEQPLSTVINGLKYFKEKDNYSEHTAIHIDAFINDKVTLTFDDEDRPKVETRINARTPSYLLFKHNTNREKDLKIDCEFEISLHETKGYLLTIHYKTKSIGTVNINEKEYNFTFFKSLPSFRLTVNDDEIPSGNPIFIDEKFFKIKEYNPILNFLKLEPIEPNERLYGTVENLYIDENKLNKAFTFHGIDLATQKKNKYNIFYFWGPWCRPCMSEMNETSELLNGLNDDVGVYNASFLIKSNEVEIEKVREIVRTNNIPGESLIEYYSKDKNTYPLIQLFGNETYPNFIVFDSNLQILKVSSSKVETADFMQTLE